MRSRRVVIILGTRPQIIKSAPVLRAFKLKSDYECSIINTGQHYDYEMNRQFFKELELPEPEVDLGVGEGRPNQQIAKMLTLLEKHLIEAMPDLAIIPGDTNSALTAGIACSKLGVKIAHLEAGCRSYDFRMSEEINRRVLDHISHILLCPTALCYDNLLAERVLATVVQNVGDTMLDSLLQFSARIEKSHATRQHNVEANSYAFMTIHRAENVDSKNNLTSILKAVGSFRIPILFAVHPRTRSRIEEFNVRIPENVKPIDPMPYFESLRLARDSKFIVTDSGGLQKEAFWLGKPSLVLRDSTEWMEIVRAGGAILTGCDEIKIRKGYLKIDGVRIGTDSERKPFGDGHASQKVVDAVVYSLKNS